MRQSFQSGAFVLKKRSLLNKDLIVTLFTEAYGRINVFAHGARKITSRRLPHIETGNFIKTLLSRKDDRFYLQETKLISGFSEIKKDQDKVNCLYVYLFVLEKVLPEGQKEEKLFRIFKLFLISLSKNRRIDRVLIKYLNQAMVALGYQKGQLPEESLYPFIEQLIGEKLPDFHI